MVKRVLTSIITLAVLMGVLIACSGEEVYDYGKKTQTQIDNEARRSSDCVTMKVIKYRDDPVNVCEFLELYDSPQSGDLRNAWFEFDWGTEYMVIDLNGTNYHYCQFPFREWRKLRNSPDKYSYYQKYIKGRSWYDCRADNGRHVPDFASFPDN